jgi:hypothetical protein
MFSTFYGNLEKLIKMEYRGDALISRIHCFKQIFVSWLQLSVENKSKMKARSIIIAFTNPLEVSLSILFLSLSKFQEQNSKRTSPEVLNQTESESYDEMAMT